MSSSPDILDVGPAKRPGAGWVVGAVVAVALVLFLVFRAGGPVEQPAPLPHSTATAASSKSPTTSQLPTTPVAPTPAPTYVTGPFDGLEVVDNDRGTVSSRSALKAIAKCASNTDTKDDAAEILYARRVSNGRDNQPGVVYLNSRNHVYLCDGAAANQLTSFEGDTVPRPSPGQAVLAFTSGESWGTSTDRPSAITQFETVATFSAPPGVREVQSLLILGGRPQKWTSAVVQNGYAFIPVSLEGKIPSVGKAAVNPVPDVRFQYRGVTVDGGFVSVVAAG